MEEISIFSLLFSGLLSSFGSLIPDNQQFAYIPADGKHMVLTGTVSKALSNANNTETELNRHVLRLDQAIFLKGMACGEITQKKIALNHSDIAAFQAKRVMIQGVVLCQPQGQKQYYINDITIQLIAD